MPGDLNMGGAVDVLAAQPMALSEGPYLTSLASFSLPLTVQATILVILFGWGFGVEKGWKLMHEGAELRAPHFYKFVLKYVTPTFLLVVFGLWLLNNVAGWNFSFTWIVSPVIRCFSRLLSARWSELAFSSPRTN